MRHNPSVGIGFYIKLILRILVDDWAVFAGVLLGRVLDNKKPSLGGFVFDFYQRAMLADLGLVTDITLPSKTIIFLWDIDTTHKRISRQGKYDQSGS